MNKKFKLGFLAFICALSLSACGLFDRPKSDPKAESAKTDSLAIDSVKIDTNSTNSGQTDADSIAQHK